MFQKGNYIVCNGVFVREEDFSVSADNRAFQYGDSLFETIFAPKGTIPFFDDHYSRLISGMKVLNYTIPADFTLQKLKEEILQLIRKNKLYKSARIRLQVYRTQGGFYSPQSNKFEYIIRSEELSHEKFSINEEGLRIKIFTALKKPVNVLSTFKTGSALFYIMAAEYKNRIAADDVLILNTYGRVAECTASNIFVVKNGKIYTPPLSEGCVDGIMRRNVMQTAKEEDLDISELPLRLKDVLNSDELFLTNAISGIRWVVGLNDRRYFSRTARHLTDLLNQRLVNYYRD